MIQTKLLVIGAGPGGYAAAFAAADLGMSVTLVDLDKNPGGVCLFRGCIPSKALLHVAKLINEAKEAKNWGVDFGEPRIDLDKLREFKNKVVGKMTGGLGQLAKQRKVYFIQGRASFTSSRSVKVELNDGGKEEIHFERAIIAIGSEIISIPIFNIKSDRLLNSTSALDLPAIPEKLLVIGGGYIGLELGSVYSALGSKVSVVEMMNGLLPGADRDMVSHLTQMLKKKFDAIMLESRVMKLDPVKNGINVTIQDKTGAERVEFYDYVLASIGRRPNTAGLGLENTKVELTTKGHIRVDNTLNTTDPYIYAIGDIAGDPMLAHKATHEARVAVETIAGKRTAFEPAAIPAVVFTDPEIAWAGITETEAREKGIKHEVAKFPWAA
ncbi:MAG: dihydrolipoyl dehydrogenase, partial [Ignavibacteriales bacterium UTCHB3]